MPAYELSAPYTPKGDQPTAIAKLVEGVNGGERLITLSSMDDADIGVDAGVIQWHDLIARQAEDHLDPLIGQRLDERCARRLHNWFS